MKQIKQCVFNKNDYSSDDGMLTSVWGPNMWHVLHTISFNYPVKPTNEDKKNYRDFIKSLQHVLPCRYCRDNLKKNIKTLHFNKSVMKNRDTFSRWIYKLHNHVNKMLGKKNTISFNEIRDRYEHFRSRCLTQSKRKHLQKGRKRRNKRSKIKQRGGRKLKEKGCTKSLYGVKSMSVINIVPRKKGVKTLKISPKCRFRR